MPIKQSKHQLTFSFEQIENATQKFTTCIGSGGYGHVYKGKLLVDGKLMEVAVKRLIEELGQGFKEFKTEIKLLSGQGHENLISLLGYCDEGKEKILVYEYAEHGSLDRYTGPRSSNTTYTLTWLQRLKICVDAARGLNHLHNHVGEHKSIIHRDIKSANILLDANWVAKISDLGLSKLSLAGLGRSAVISRPCGTHGYYEPEYIASGIVTKESDVYSFGVVLFEVLCGRLCTVEENGGFMLSAKLVKDKYETRNLDEIIEPDLRKQMSTLSLNRFSTTSYRCLHDDRRQRPPMDLVVKELERSMKIQEKYELDKEAKLKSPSDEYWEIILPDDVGDIISVLYPPLVYATKKELFSLLLEGFFIDHDQRFFFINNDGIKCEMISAHTFLDWKSKTMTWRDIIMDTSIFKPRGERTDVDVPTGRGRPARRDRPPDSEEYMEPPSCSVMGQYPHKYSLDISCKISTSMLSLGVLYAANLVFSFGMWNKRDSATSLTNWVWIKWKCQDLRVSSAHYAQRLNYGRNENGIIMLKATLWHFVNIDKNANFDIVINRILGAAEFEFPYIVIHGIIFQPVDMIQDGALASDEDAYWEKKMPSDYEKIIARSDMHLEYNTKKALYFLLCGGILIDNGQKWFSLCKSTGGKCLMLQAERKRYGKDTNHEHTDKLSFPESRFKKVLQLERERYFGLECKIDPTMLSSGRVYACYLIFKLENFDTTPQERCKLKTKCYWAKGYEAYAYLELRKPINIPIIKPTKDNRFRDSRHIPKFKDSVISKGGIDGMLNNYMEQRNDGWMEILLYQGLYSEKHQNFEVTLNCKIGNLDRVIIEGIEFRPLEREDSSKGKKLSDLFVKWATER